MESLKKYLPLIAIAIAGYFLLRMFKGFSPTILPQTQLTQTPQPDPYAATRLPAFQSLAELAGIQTQAETQSKQIASDLELGKGALQNVTQQQNFQYALGSQGIIAQLQSQLRQLDIAESLGLKSSDTELAKTELETELAKYLQSAQLDYNRFAQNSYLQALQLNLQQREQDRQLQQAAIDRYYSSRNTGNIIGSISQAIAGIFGGGGGGGSIFGTPPTFPSFGGFGGF
jgi:hypothetical protein